VKKKISTKILVHWN